MRRSEDVGVDTAPALPKQVAVDDTPRGNRRECYSGIAKKVGVDEMPG
jgi:hypothetical protein